MSLRSRYRNSLPGGAAVLRAGGNPAGLRSGKVALALMLALVCGTPGKAQEHDHSQAWSSIPAEILARPLPIRTGIGTSHEPVTTSSDQAQAYFDQGLAYLHSYVWIEAARSFNQALRLDPKLAMADLGLSYAYSGLGANSAATAIMARVKESGPMNDLERERMSIRSAQLDAIARPADTTLRARYVEAIDRALKRFPKDPELWLLRGNAEEPSAAGWGQRGGESGLQYYEKALSLSPDYFAAHHYLIHSLENLGRIQEALVHGEAYARLAPAIPHAHHMYGHDLRRVGRIDDAIKQFEAAYEEENAYYKSENIPAEYDWHHQHNLDLLSSAYQYVGRISDAERLMKESFSFTSTQENLEFDKKEWPAFLLSQGRSEEALEAAKVLIAERWAAVRAIGHVMAAHALMALGRLPDAASEAKSAVSEAHNDPASLPYLAPYLEVLQGEFFLRTGHADQGRSLLEAVEKRVRAEPGPDAWSQGLFVLEMIGRLARNCGDWELAEFTAGQMNEHDPAYGGTHYALGLAAEHRRDVALALKELNLAEQSWKEADTDFPELKQVRAKLAALGAP
jgi:tetratricopeptide (TPR) repeat protein